MKEVFDDSISVFSELAAKSFEFWDNKQDGIYHAFYSKRDDEPPQHRP
jgi:hypothetical protein